MRAPGTSWPGSPPADPVPDGAVPRRSTPGPPAFSPCVSPRALVCRRGGALLLCAWGRRGRLCDRNDEQGPRLRACRLPRGATSGRLVRHSLPRGSRHLFREGRRRREVRETAKAKLLLQQEAARVFLSVALRPEGATSVAHVPLPARGPQPGADQEGGPPRGALLPGLPLEAAVSPVGGDNTVKPHVELLRPAVAHGVAQPVWAVGEP